VSDITPNDPPIVDYDLFESQELDSVNVEPLPLSIIKEKPHSFYEGYLSYYHRYITLPLAMAPLSGANHDMDVEVELDFYEGGLSNGAFPKIIMYMDSALRKFFMLKKDLTAESLRWFLPLQEFEFGVCDKG